MQGTRGDGPVARGSILHRQLIRNSLGSCVQKEKIGREDRKGQTRSRVTSPGSRVRQKRSTEGSDSDGIWMALLLIWRCEVESKRIHHLGLLAGCGFVLFIRMNEEDCFVQTNRYSKDLSDGLCSIGILIID